MAGVDVPSVEPVFNDDTKVKINVSLPEPAGAMATQRAKDRGLTLGPYCKWLLAALANRSGSDLGNVGGDEPPAGLLGEILTKMRVLDSSILFRESQSEYNDQLRHALQNGVIGLCEAGTGTGKTLAIAAAAAEIAIGKVVSCGHGPSRPVALMRQFASTYRKNGAICRGAAYA
jgi:hypothetical protein